MRAPDLLAVGLGKPPFWPCYLLTNMHDVGHCLSNVRHMGFTKDKDRALSSSNICPSCGIHVSADARYCRVCGLKLVRCSSCGSIVGRSSRFCSRCGRSLTYAPQPVAQHTQPRHQDSVKGVAVALLLIFILLGSSYFILRLSQTGLRPSVITDTTPPQIQEYVQIKVSLTRGNSQWGRNPSTDLPQLSVTIAYTVGNDGTASAQNAHILVLLDNNAAKDYFVVITSRDRHSSSVDFVFLYDTTHKVSVDASCSGSSDQASLVVDAHLNRSPTLEPDVARLYITPNDPVVRATLNVVAKSPIYSVSKWTTIRDWVSLKIRYEGAGNYWQLPRETLQRKAGVCKEYSTLLVSLLRAAGYSEDRVFVVLGRKGETVWHAWVRIRVDVIGWQSIEPQAPSLMTFIGDRLVLSGYVAMYHFNDVSYVSFSEARAHAMDNTVCFTQVARYAPMRGRIKDPENIRQVCLRCFIYRFPNHHEVCQMVRASFLLNCLA
jgi:hypothetical protein